MHDYTQSYFVDIIVGYEGEVIQEAQVGRNDIHVVVVVIECLIR
jgi:hypothetical protein